MVHRNHAYQAVELYLKDTPSGRDTNPRTLFDRLSGTTLGRKKLKEILETYKSQLTYTSFEKFCAINKELCKGMGKGHHLSVLYRSLKYDLAEEFKLPTPKTYVPQYRPILVKTSKYTESISKYLSERTTNIISK